MNCIRCNNYISSTDLLLNGIKCKNKLCSSTFTDLIYVLENTYSWFTYLIFHKNICVYVGHTLELYNRFASHIKSNTAQIPNFNKNIKLSYSDLEKYNLKFHISLHLSEKDAYHLFKPTINFSYGLCNSYIRVFDNTIEEYKDISTEHLTNVYKDSLLLANNKFTKSYNSPAGELMTTKNIPIPVKDDRLYCYKWFGECLCKLPCIVHVKLINLIHQPHIADTYVSKLKQFKKNEKMRILEDIGCLEQYTSMMHNTQYIKTIREKYINNLHKYIENPPYIGIPYRNSKFEIKEADESNSKMDDTQEKILSEHTLTRYNQIIKTITKAYNSNYNSSLPILQILNNHNNVISLIKQKYAESTSLTYISAILWYIKQMYNNKDISEKEYGLLKSYYTSHHGNILSDSIENTKKRDGELTEKENKNYLYWEEVLNVRKEMLAVLDKGVYNDLLDFLIVSLYTLHPPIRADYGNMKVFLDNKSVPENYKENYCVINTDPRFVFWKFKNAGITNLPVVIKIENEELYDIIMDWLNINDSGYLLAVYRPGIKKFSPMSENCLSQRVKSIFKLWTTKGASINTLRHSFISYNTKDDYKLAEKRVIASKMMHTPAMVDVYRRDVY